MKYIQSFYQYPVTFSSIGRTVPARSAQGELKNIAEVSEKELEKLNNCEPRFRELINQKKYRVLKKLPESYVPPAVQVNNANAEADRLKRENEALKARLAELSGEAAEAKPSEEEKPEESAVKTEGTDVEKMDYKDLQEAAKARGINPNQKKAALIEALKDAE